MWLYPTLGETDDLIATNTHHATVIPHQPSLWEEPYFITENKVFQTLYQTSKRLTLGKHHIIVFSLVKPKRNKKKTKQTASTILYILK